MLGADIEVTTYFHGVRGVVSGATAAAWAMGGTPLNGWVFALVCGVSLSVDDYVGKLALMYYLYSIAGSTQCPRCGAAASVVGYRPG